MLHGSLKAHIFFSMGFELLSGRSCILGSLAIPSVVGHLLFLLQGADLSELMLMG